MHDTNDTQPKLHAMVEQSFSPVTSADGQRCVESASSMVGHAIGALTREMADTAWERMRNRSLFPEPSSDQLIAEHYMRIRMRNAGLYGPLAQMVEQSGPNGQVAGSSPVGTS